MAQQMVPTPDVPINFVPVKEGEVLHLGTITIRIMGQLDSKKQIVFTLRERKKRLRLLI